MSKRWVALVLFAFLAAVAASGIPLAPLHDKMVATGGDAWWFLWFDQNGVGPKDRDNGFAGTVVKGEPVGPLIRDGYCTLQRLQRVNSSSLGGTIAVTKCEMP